MKKRLKKSELGYSLLELLTAIGILGIVSLVAFSLYLNSQQSVKEIKVVNTMRAIAKSIEIAAQNPAVIAFSAFSGRNIALENCILTRSNYKADKYQKAQIEGSTPPADSNSPTLCTATNPKSQVPIFLYNQPKDWASVSPSAMRRLLLSGTQTQPIWRDINGRLCSDPNEAKCRIKVVSFMWASCPKAANVIRENIVKNDLTTSLSTNCYRAQNINIRFQVSYVPKSRIQENSSSCSPFPKRFPSIPRDRNFWLEHDSDLCFSSINGKQVEGFRRKKTNTNAAFTTEVSQIGRYSDFIEACSQNYTMIEIRDSKPICKCLPPFKEINSTFSKQCILDNHHCAENQRYVGTDLSGSPICKNVHCFRKFITLKNLADFSCLQDEKGDTRKGGWLNEIAVNGGNLKNCSCEDVAEGPDFDINGWYYRCNLKCKFSIQCCFEQE